MESYHNGHHEDRKYRYFYQNSQNWVLSDCFLTDLLNEFDKDVNYNLGIGQVIAGNRWNYG